MSQTSLLDSYLDPYFEAYDVSQDCDPFELISAAINKSVVLPQRDIQQPIMVAAALMPSKDCNVLPLCISYGKSGTGKSTYGKIIHGIWGLDPRYLLAGKTTPTAIRNLLQAMKYGDEWTALAENLPEEKNAILIWDDIDPGILSDPLIQSILKSGYSRKTANIAIANAGGENQYFNFFSSKFTSTIHPIWAEESLGELKRRSLVFNYKPYSLLSEEDLANNPDLDDLVDVDYVSFEGYQGHRRLYLDLAEKQSMRSLNNSLRGKLRYSQLPKDFGKLCFDLLSVGTALGFFLNLNDAIDKLERFCSYQEQVLQEKSEFQLWIEGYIEREEALQRELLQVRAGYPITISRSKLQRDYEKAVNNNELPRERVNLREKMKSLGYNLVSDNGMKFVKEVRASK